MPFSITFVTNDNKVVSVAVGERTPDGVTYEVFEIL